MSNSKLYARTREALANRPRTQTYDDIAINTSLTVRWLQQFAAGSIEDPGVNKVETLYEYLTGTPLDV